MAQHLPIPAKGKYYDLNLPYEENKTNIESVNKLCEELGYSVVAFSTFVASGSFKKTPKSKKHSSLVTARLPVKIESNDNCTYLSRITIELKEVDDQIAVRDLTSSGNYDIVAVQPKTEKLFLSACTNLNVDIIAFDGSERFPYFKTHQVRAAIARGICFELCYAPMIRDPVVRRITTTNGIKLVECCKGKNIIISSNARNASELRGPHDAANLGLLFGIKENMVPHTVSSNCRNVVVHGFAQKTAKGAIYVQRIENQVTESKKRNNSDEDLSDNKKCKILE